MGEPGDGLSDVVGFLEGADALGGGMDVVGREFEIKDVEIFGADGNYQYNYNNQLKNFDNINEAISAYILEMHEAGNEI